MTISKKNARILRSAHFSPKEIKDINEAKDPAGNLQPPIDINNDAWLFAIQSRVNWYNKMKNAKWTEQEIAQEIRNCYRRGVKRTPFDFLEGYKQRKRVKISRIKS